MLVEAARRDAGKPPPQKKEPARPGRLLGTRAPLTAQAARDVAENVLDLVAENDEDHDDDNRDKNQNEGVLDHSLAFLLIIVATKKLLEL